YLAVLARAEKITPARRQLIEGDLHLTLNDRVKALACYRGVARRMGSHPGHTWARGFVPPGYYFVERDRPLRFDELISARYTAPFFHGPGSHLDNWLLRRFIALEAWPEAEAELARIADIHRFNSRPHVVSHTALDVKLNKEVTTDHVVRPAGFDSVGLQF